MLFYYKREIKEAVPVENPVEGEPKQKIVSSYVQDCFNVDKVIRGHWISKDVFTVILDDGHEQADDVEKPKLNAKRQVVGVEVKRERGWYMSQINLDKEDAERFKEMSDIMNKVAVWEYAMRVDPYVKFPKDEAKY